MKAPVRGFTMVELMVALTVAGLLVLSASALHRSVTAVPERFSADRSAWDRHANMGRLLRSALGSAAPGDGPSRPFTGLPASVTFPVRAIGPAGWFGDAEGAIVRQGDRIFVTLGAAGGLIMPCVERFSLAYLTPAREWKPAYASLLLPPLAVRAVWTSCNRVSDTLLARLGARG